MFFEDTAVFFPRQIQVALDILTNSDCLFVFSDEKLITDMETLQELYSNNISISILHMMPLVSLHFKILRVSLTMHLQSFEPLLCRTVALLKK